MLMLVSYDVSTVDRAGRARLRKVAKTCTNWGIRVQNSVFECHVDSAQWVRLKAELETICDPKTDSLRYYNLGSRYQGKTEHYGAKPAPNPETDLLSI